MRTRRGGNVRENDSLPSVDVGRPDGSIGYRGSTPVGSAYRAGIDTLRIRDGDDDGGEIAGRFRRSSARYRPSHRNQGRGPNRRIASRRVCTVETDWKKYSGLPASGKSGNLLLAGKRVGKENMVGKVKRIRKVQGCHRNSHN